MLCHVCRGVVVRLLGGLVLIVSLVSNASAAAHRTTNFIVTAPQVGLAREIADLAEVYRRELAIEWLGHELPRWEQPIPVTAQVGPHLGAGGATSFMFDRGHPFGWRMSIQGSRERLLDSVLPHEITHTIFATHFGRPLPRWADEGACTTVEHESEKAKQQHFLMRFLRSTPPRSIPFNKMFRMTEYPHDIMPLYAQGHSVAKFLLQQGGKRKFVDYIASGLSDQNWDRATDEFYGYRDLSDLQVKWVAWVADGSRDLESEDMYVQNQAPQPAVHSDAVADSKHSSGRTGFIEQLAAAGTGFRPMGHSASATHAQSAYLSRPRNSVAHPSDSWYARHRDAARTTWPTAEGPTIGAQATARAQGVQQPNQMVLEWDRQLHRSQPPWSRLDTAARPDVQLRRRASEEAPVYFDGPIREPLTLYR